MADPQHSVAGGQTGSRRALWLALVAGLLIRVAGRWLWTYQDVDGASYIEMVSDLLAGQGLATAGLRYWPPLYPGLAAALAWPTGLAAGTAAGVVAAVSSAALVLPAWSIGRTLGGPRAATWAAWAAALLPALALAGHRDHAEATGLLLLLGSLAVALPGGPLPGGPLPGGPLTGGRALARGVGAGLLLGLAFLTRFELVLGLPAVALALWTAPRRQRAIGGLALGLCLPLLPYQALLLHLGEGFVVPDSRLASNLAETLSAGQLGFGFDDVGTLGARSSPVDDPGAVLSHRAVQLGRALWQLPRAVPPAVALLALLGGRILGRRRWLPPLLLGLPCLASAIVVDHEVRYWLSLTVALLPLAAVAMARLPRLWRSQRWAWLLPLGLLSWPRAEFPDGPIAVLGPGEDLLSVLADPATTWLASEGALLMAVRPLAILLAAGCFVAWARRRAPGPGLHAALALACAASLSVWHLEHGRASLPGRDFDANLGLMHRVPGQARMACARPLDAHVAGATFVPPPRVGLGPEQVDRYLRARGVDYVLLDPEDARGGSLAGWAASAAGRSELEIEATAGGLVLARRTAAAD